MTEKRFTEVFPNIIESSCSFKDNGVGITHKEVCSLLNKLNDENEQLKKEFHSCGHNWGLMYDEAKEKIEELDKENEQLKQLVDEAEDIIVCQCTPYYQRIWESIKKNIEGDME